MAKKEVGEQKANLYLLAIVAIVAVVGIVVLVLNSGGVSVSSDDLSGQALVSGRSAATACRDCPNNCNYNTVTGKYSCLSASEMVDIGLRYGASVQSAASGVVCGSCDTTGTTMLSDGETCITCLNPK